MSVSFFTALRRAASCPVAAASLAVMVPDDVTRVGLVVDADDTTLESILRKVPLDMLQLHGDESPERVEESEKPISGCR